MKNILFLIAIFNCISLLVGGENQVVIYAKKGMSNLYYTGKESIDKCKEFNRVAQYNSPCFAGCQYSSKEIFDPSDALFTLSLAKARNGNELPKDMEEVDCKSRRMAAMYNILKDLNDHRFNRVIPWTCFVKVNEKNELQYKAIGDILFSFVGNIEGEEITFEVKLESDLGKINPQDDINNFREYVLCTFGDEEGLLKAGIIMKDEKGLRRHWLNSYFGDEIKAKQAAEKWALFYSRFKSCLKIVGGISFTGIIMYVLYQKLYTTS